jgi:hypothetical protein
VQALDTATGALVCLKIIKNNKVRKSRLPKLFKAPWSGIRHLMLVHSCLEALWQPASCWGMLHLCELMYDMFDW